MSTELRKITKLSWRRLINSEHGTEGILWVKEQAPRIAASGEAHSIIFQAGKAEGYVEAIDKIYQLIAPDSTPDQDIENR